MTGALDQDANFPVGTTSVVRLVVVRHGHSSRGARTVHRRAPMGDPDRLHPRSRVYPPGSLTAAPKDQKYHEPVTRASLVNLGVLPNPSRVSGWLVFCGAASPVPAGREVLFSRPTEDGANRHGLPGASSTLPTYSHSPTARFTALWLAPSGVCLGKAAGTGRLGIYDDDDLGEAMIISHSPPCGQGEVDDDSTSVQGHCH
ncbi:hypothetical protein BO94DRAFT_529946 [Aspergillus sclerotioniger CBS 115572]|uniref:Uncharacterized protein n=1 Tax=Aspergillus sclerotioniger CBS 115572 TaxID=1450535 RepID=A0A317XFJ9_9EURO|nr:hypothetical protein BO94DRAFT_529946 [Aspergillus sclerotioniger CBS 115572]PWY96577.1 hypothetical protein BO94DRAFT_529946 [Aspergillus sclerotioniger CBS 115572]